MPTRSRVRLAGQSAPLKDENLTRLIGLRMTAATQQRSVRPGGGFSRLAWAVAMVALVLLLLPYLLVPVYRIVTPVSTLMLARWLTGRNVVRTYMPIDRLGPTLPLAVLVAEDDRFCSHHG